MNCKKGELAVINAGKKQRGKVVTCLAYVGIPEFVCDFSDVWRVDKEVRWVQDNGEVILRPYISDSMLVPM